MDSPIISPIVTHDPRRQWSERTAVEPHVQGEMALPHLDHHQDNKHWGKEADRGLRHGGDVASEVVRYAYGNIPRALAWAVPNALWTAAYIPLGIHAVVSKAYNAAWGTQRGGRRYELVDGHGRRWYNHWSRFHLTPDDPETTLAPHLPYPTTMPSWAWVRDRVPGPDWHKPDYPPPPADHDVFDEHERYTGLKDRSPEESKRYIEYITNAMLEDAETLSRLIQTDVFPPGHLHAGEPRYGNLCRAFRVAELIDQAERMDGSAERMDGSAGEATARARSQREAATLVRETAEHDAKAYGFENATAAVALRDAQVHALMKLNAMHYTNILQMHFECQEAKHTLDLIVKLHQKDFWNRLIWGYLGYDSAYKSAAEKADNRLRGLLQEVDPLDSRRQKGPFGV